MKILICGHARFSEGIISAEKLIVGEMEEVIFLNSYMDGIDFKKELAEIIPDEECCILTDLFGGSVNQEVMQYLKTKDVHVITGVNLPLVLELVIENNQGNLNLESIRRIVETSRQQLMYVNDQLTMNSTDDFE